MTKDEYQQRLMDVQEICNKVLSGDIRDCFAVDLVNRILPVIRGQA